MFNKTKMEFNFLKDRIEIKHQNGKLWDSDPDLYFNDQTLCLKLTFLDKIYTKNFQNESEYLKAKSHCSFYF